jgi:transposase
MRLKPPFKESSREKRASCTWPSNWVEKNWRLSLSDGARSLSHYTVAAGNTAALLECMAKAKARCGLAPEARVHSCYEAGRDGFWLHRWLIAHGIDNIVVGSKLYTPRP